MPQLQRLRPGGDYDEAIEIELRERVLGDELMPDVRRIEAAAENPQAHELARTRVGRGHRGPGRA